MSAEDKDKPILQDPISTLPELGVPESPPTQPNGQSFELDEHPAEVP